MKKNTFYKEGKISFSASAAPFAYILNSGSNTVFVIDTATNQVTSTIGIDPDSYGVAVTLDESKVYVANLKTNYLFIIENS